MTTIVTMSNPCWTRGTASLASFDGVEAYALTRGRHAGAFGIDTTQGDSAWRHPDW